MLHVDELQKEILKLKKDKGYVLIGHNYVINEILELCDIIGDSLGLAREALKVKKDKIMFVGVDFMAETMKCLNSNKRVYVPNKLATCPMANSLSVKNILDAKKKYPNVPVVLYVNTKIECKAESDYTCTSANAVDIIQKIDSNTIIFGPDKNLGNYVRQKTGKNIILIPGESGFCYVHDKIKIEAIERAKISHPNAKIISHPECRQNIIENSHYVGSTGQMTTIAKKDDANEFIIGTEVGMLSPLKSAVPKKKFYALSVNAVCSNMKKNTLLNLYEALKNDKYEILINKELIERSKISIFNMLNL